MKEHWKEIKGNREISEEEYLERRKVIEEDNKA